MEFIKNDRTVIIMPFFGHVKWSFTGALNDRKGLFKAANAGTIFLDKIGE
jgi:two-component system response regulator PilR (NtrC family)